MSDGTPQSTSAAAVGMAALPPSPTAGHGAPDTLGLDDAPPLAGLCALAAFVALIVNQLVLPALKGGATHRLFVPFGHVGRFSANLAVIAGTFALLMVAYQALRAPAFMRLRRRVLVVVFLTLLLRAVVIATFFDREETTKESVYFAVGAANVLCVFAGMAAFDRVRSILGRVLAGLATATPLVSMLAVTLELSADLSFDPWKRRAHEWLAGSGEVAYLALIACSALLLVPRAVRARAAFARSLGFFILMATLVAFHQAEHRLHADYTVLLYHAQHVGLALDRFPLAYALPFALALGAVASAVAAGGLRFQAGVALLLIVSSGYAPQTPGRLLCMTLGFALFSRALAMLDAATPTPTSTTSPSSTRA